MPTPHKTCSKCGDTKPLDEYSKKRASKDGHQDRCRVCTSRGARAYRKKNREKVKEYRRAYREKNREEINARQREYRKENPEKVKEYRRAYREKNWEKDIEYSRAYRKENEEYNRRRVEQWKGGAQERTRLTATRNRQPWEQWEDDFIANHPEMTDYQIATHIGRTYASTQARKFRLRKKGVPAQ